MKRPERQPNVNAMEKGSYDKNAAGVNASLSGIIKCMQNKVNENTVIMKGSEVLSEK